MKKKRKIKKKLPMIQGRDPVAQLYRAVLRYVESRGGKIVVIGGIEIQEWPTDGPMKFRVAVRILGRKPVLPEASR